MSDAKLLANTELLVREERRRLYAALGYSSLFQYAVRKLGYPDSQAHRRMVAVKMLRELPEIEEKIAKGSLNLTHISMAKIVFRTKGLDRAEKIALLERLEGKSTREASAILAEIAPQSARPDKIRMITGDTIELRFVASKALREKIEILKGRLAHNNPCLDLGRLFEFLCDEQLRTINKLAAPTGGVRQSFSSLRKSLLSRGSCENCGSTYALEIDHRHPVALGGTNAPENLRVLCRACNQRAAIEAFGQKKMDLYL
ncbi:MAG: HNH endonuclease [Bacteriovoracia bacterium]